MQHRELQAQLLAAVHRWEANLLELKDLLTEISDFVREAHIQDSSSDESAILSPLQVPLELVPRQLARYKRLSTRLIQKTKDLNHDCFSLLEKLHDDTIIQRLAESLSTVRAHLQKVAQMRSLRSSLDEAQSTVDDVLQDAAALRSSLSQ
jgi:hypothetical protein